MASARSGLPSPFLQCDPAATVGGTGDPALIVSKFREAWLPYFCRSVRGVADVEDFYAKIEGVGQPVLNLVDLPPFTGDVLVEFVRRRRVTVGGLDGWRWRELKAIPLVRWVSSHLAVG